MSDLSNTSQNGKVKAGKSRQKRSWLRWLGWSLVIAFLLLLLVVLIAWLNRYSIMEDQARKEFERAGIDASFDIESVSGTKAVINALSLSFDNKEFLAAEQLTLEYTLEKIRNGDVDKVVLKAPILNLTLDEKGAVIDKWIPEPSGDETPINFPKDGIAIDDALVNWTAPFGTGEANFDASLDSSSEWQALIKSSSSVIQSEDIDLSLVYDGKINRANSDELGISGTLKARDVRVRQSGIERIDADFDIDLKTEPGREDVQVDGELDLSTAQALLPGFSAKEAKGQFEFDGLLDGSRSNFTRFNSNWDVNGEGLSLSDPALRTRLVQNTMAYNALSNTPVAMHFVDHFERNGRRFLELFSFEGSGTYAHDESGYSVDFKRDIVMTSVGQKLVAKPIFDNEIVYSKANSEIKLGVDIDWLGARDLYFKNLELTGQSEKGLLLTGVRSVTTGIRSTRTWSASSDGEEIRLAPLILDLDYSRDASVGRLILNGGIDYDGPLPGGLASGFRASGVVDLDLRGSNFNMAFSPEEPVRIDEFVSVTGWRAENVDLTIADAANVLARSGTSRPLGIAIRDVTADIISPENDRHLAAGFEHMQIRTDFNLAPQQWQLDITGIEMRSDDFPSPGTHILSPAGTAKVFQFADGHIEFDIDSPLTRVDTENAQIQDLSIQMAGLPDDFTAQYLAGKVKLKGSDMPELPMRGTARLAAGELTGSAIAQLPESKETDINIEYRSKEGIGSAHITIPKIVFEPRGLQPQYVIPALRGRLAEVSGSAAAEFEFAFSGGGPVSSFGSTTLNNLQVGTIVGPFSGVNADLSFNSIFPLQTTGIQTATVSGFDPGFPLENGVVKFEMVPEGVRIHEAKWPVLSPDGEIGRIYIEPLLWKLGDVENRAVVVVENLSLGTVTAGIGNENLSASGQIYGRLPVKIKGVEVLVDNGVLSVKDGGVISYKNQGIDTFAKESEVPSLLGEGLEGAGTGFAFKALENFQYKELSAEINGPLDGEMVLSMSFDGKNPDVLYGATFNFNVSVAGKLANIVRNTAQAFSTESHIDNLIELNEQNEGNGP